MKTKITLIIPVFNVEKYLVQCLESVVIQTVPFDEVILINDGSTDNSGDICKKYTKSYSYFKLIEQENCGPSVARNIGINNATGDYIVFLDADDWLRKDCVDILSTILEKNSLDALYFDANIIFDMKIDKISKNIYDRSKAGLDGKVMDGREYFIKSYPQYYVVSACLGIYKREQIKKFGIEFPEGIYFEDNYFTFAFLNKARHVLHISEMLYQRRLRPNSTMTSEYSEKKYMDFIKCIQLIWDYILIEKWNEEKTILKKFVIDHYMQIIDRYRYCIEINIKMKNNIVNNLLILTNRFCQIFSYLEENDISNKIKGLNCLQDSLVEIKKWDLNIDKVINNFKKYIVNKQKEIYTKILKSIPLNDYRLKIGIYGTGNHTEGLLMMYEQIIGKIKCKLVFIDSNCDGEIYKNRDVINYQKVDNSFDYVIISSFLYEKEMLNNLRSVNKETEVISFYDTIYTDAFSGYINFYKCEMQI